MATFNAYLAFVNTKEALAYYEEVFGAKNISRLAVTAEQAGQFGVPVEMAENMTMHSQFDILGVTFMAADNFQGSELNYSGITLMLSVDPTEADSVAEAEAFWANLAASGKVKVEMPYEKQFWGDKLGTVLDQYGIRWQLREGLNSMPA